MTISNTAIEFELLQQHCGLDKNTARELAEKCCVRYLAILAEGPSTAHLRPIVASYPAEQQHQPMRHQRHQKISATSQRSSRQSETVAEYPHDGLKSLCDVYGTVLARHALLRLVSSHIRFLLL